VTLMHNDNMSIDEVSTYLDALDEPKRATLQKLRETIIAVIPDAEQGLSYTVPAFRLRGKVVAGFAAFKNHSVTCRTAVRSFRNSKRN